MASDLRAGDIVRFHAEVRHYDTSSDGYWYVKGPAEWPFVVYVYQPMGEISLARICDLVKVGQVDGK